MDFWRQLDLVKPDALQFPIHLIGAGGIGSPAAAALVKMGCRRLSVWDPDSIEPHNLPNQFYRLADVGRPKVEALKEILAQYGDAAVEAHQVLVEGQPLKGVVISAVDSMESRRKIWERSVRYRAAIPLYIDARMGGEVLRIFTVVPTDPDQVARYESSLHSDQEAQELACTAQAIIYNSFATAALIANQVRRHAVGETLAGDIVLDLNTLTLLTQDELP